MKPWRQINQWLNLRQVYLLKLRLLRCLHLAIVFHNCRRHTRMQRFMLKARLDRPTSRCYHFQVRLLLIDHSLSIARLNENLSWDTLTRCGFNGQLRHVIGRRLFVVVVSVLWFALPWNTVLDCVFWFGDCYIDFCLLAKICQRLNFNLFFPAVIGYRLLLLLGLHR